MSETFDEFVARLQFAYKRSVRPFLEGYALDRLEAFDADFGRFPKLREAARKELAICFLGHSGVGKSTLLNVLVDGRMAVLPAGGVGPLTAQATRVKYSDRPFFEVSYLPGNVLNRLLFALEKHYENEQRKLGLTVTPHSDEIEATLNEEDRADVVAVLPPTEAQEAGQPAARVEGDQQAEAVESPGQRQDGGASKIEAYRRQANLLVRGEQYANIELPYVVHCLRTALGLKRHTELAIDEGDQGRLTALRAAVELGRARQPRRYSLNGNGSAFYEALEVHASGHLAPLIKSIEVGWPAPILREGLTLVDLPGVGVANDEYRAVTREAIRAARAVVVVVDRSGFTVDSAELLRTTGFLNSLLYDTHDTDEQSPILVLAVVKLDQVATSARQTARARGESVRPWIDYFNETCDEAADLIGNQIRDELKAIALRGPESTLAERLRTVETVVKGLRVHPVSALEYWKLNLSDADEPARIKQPGDSRIPVLAAHLQAIAQTTIQENGRRFRDHVNGVRVRLERTLQLVKHQWDDEAGVAEEVERLRAELDQKLKPLHRQLDNRKGQYRGFLRDTIPQAIETSVLKATQDAERDIRRYLAGLHDYHWATLRAAVQRGGAWDGKRRVHLPEELSLRFEEPVAVVWSKDILAALRKKTRELGEDYVGLQAELVEWARSLGARVKITAVESLHEDLKTGVKGFATVGKGAIDELKQKVRAELLGKVEADIARRCQRFVDDKKDAGPGVKRRILELFAGELTEAVLTAAQKAATKVLKDNYSVVEVEINGELKRFPDPLQQAADQIVASHEVAARRADKGARKRFNESHEAAASALPQAPVE